MIKPFLNEISSNLTNAFNHRLGTSTTMNDIMKEIERVYTTPPYEVPFSTPTKAINATWLHYLYYMYDVIKVLQRFNKTYGSAFPDRLAKLANNDMRHRKYSLLTPFGAKEHSPIGIEAAKKSLHTLFKRIPPASYSEGDSSRAAASSSALSSSPAGGAGGPFSPAGGAGGPSSPAGGAGGPSSPSSIPLVASGARSNAPASSSSAAPIKRTPSDLILTDLIGRCDAFFMKLLTAIITPMRGAEIYTDAFYNFGIRDPLSRYQVPVREWPQREQFATNVKQYPEYNNCIAITYFYFTWREGITIPSPPYLTVKSTTKRTIVDLYTLITSGFWGNLYADWIRIYVNEPGRGLPPPISGFLIPKVFSNPSLTNQNIINKNISLPVFLKICTFILKLFIDKNILPNTLTGEYNNGIPPQNFANHATNVAKMLYNINIYDKKDFDVLFTLVSAYDPSVTTQPIRITYWVAESTANICAAGEFNKTGFELLKKLNAPIQRRLAEDGVVSLDTYCGHSISSYQAAYMIMRPPPTQIQVIPYISSEPSTNTMFQEKVADIAHFFNEYMPFAKPFFNDTAAPITYNDMGTNYEKLKALFKGNGQDSILFVNKLIIRDLYKGTLKTVDDFSIHKTVWAKIGSTEFEPIDTTLYYTPDIPIPTPPNPNEICRRTGASITHAALVTYYTPSTAGGALRKKKRSTRIQKKAKKYRGRRTRRASKGRIGA